MVSNFILTGVGGMNLAILFYAIGVLNGLGIASILIMSASAVFTVFCVLGWLFNRDWADFDSEGKPLNKEATYMEVFQKSIKKSAIVSATFLTLSILIPTKTDMYIMTGLVVGEKIITSEKGNELMDKSYELLVAKIDEATKEATEDKKPTE